MGTTTSPKQEPLHAMLHPVDWIDNNMPGILFPCLFSNLRQSKGKCIYLIDLSSQGRAKSHGALANTASPLMSLEREIVVPSSPSM